MTIHGPRVYVRRLHSNLGLFVLIALVAAFAAVLIVAGARPASEPSGLIAFARGDGIYVMRSDGSGVRALWHGGHGLNLSTWSPNLTWSRDGRRLAFEVRGAIWTIDAEGAHLFRVASHATSPAWSPDGRRIAFIPTQENPNLPGHPTTLPKRAIWVANADGTGMRRLLSLSRLGGDLDARPYNLNWSPDGRQIVLTARYGWLAWNYVVNVDGTHLRRLTEQGWAYDGDPEWSPDGRRIVYFGTPPRPRPSVTDNTSETFVMDRAGRSHVRLTRNSVGDESPTWSPDGSQIAFVRGDMLRRDSSEIYVMNADGSGARRLTENRVAEGSLAWQPVAAP